MLLFFCGLCTKKKSEESNRVYSFSYKLFLIQYTGLVCFLKSHAESDQFVKHYQSLHLI